MDANSKPKRPLSAYNLFFQWERERILQGQDHLKLPIAREDLVRLSRARQNKPKRPHRKSHGKIGFRQLARTIADRWKRVSDEDRALCEDQARIEKHEYDRLVEEQIGHVSGNGRKEESPSTQAAGSHVALSSLNREDQQRLDDDKSSSQEYGCHDMIPRTASSDQMLHSLKGMQKDIESAIRAIEDGLSTDEHPEVTNVPTYLGSACGGRNNVEHGGMNHHIISKNDTNLSANFSHGRNMQQEVESVIRSLDERTTKELLQAFQPILSNIAEHTSPSSARASHLLAQQSSSSVAACNQVDGTFDWGARFFEQQSSSTRRGSLATVLPSAVACSSADGIQFGAPLTDQKRTPSVINFRWSQIFLLEGLLDDATEKLLLDAAAGGQKLY